MDNTDKLEILVLEQKRTIELLAHRVSKIEAYLHLQREEAEAVWAWYEGSRARRRIQSQQNH